MTPQQGRVLRGLYLALGVACVSVALVGIVLPVIPVTFPTLLAAYFFARSSPRFDRWLTSHRLFGPIVRDWRAGVGFTRRAKIIATVGIVASFVFTGAVAVQSVGGRIVWALLAVSLCAYVLSRPTKPDPDITLSNPGRWRAPVDARTADTARSTDRRSPRCRRTSQ